jgi:ankyrin repeat protein
MATALFSSWFYSSRSSSPASSSCCSRSLAQSHYQKVVTEELFTVLQWKSVPHDANATTSMIDLVRPRVQAVPGAVWFRDDYENYLLHTAVSNGASLEILECLVRAGPTCLQEVGSEGDYPLHLACVVGAPLPVIRYLTEAWPGALTAPNKRHKRPLHLVCARQPAVDLVDYLVAARPAALRTKDKSRDTPLHVACAHKASAAVVSLLMQANPATLRLRNLRGETPLHAATGVPQADLAVVQVLACVWPESLSTSSHRGDTPLHVACCHASSGNAASEQVRHFLVHENPSVLRQKNQQGHLPLHMACLHQASTRTIYLLVESAPETVGVVDHQDNLPVHLACRHAAPATAVRLLLDALPEAIRSTNAAGNLPLHEACLAHSSNTGVSLEVVHACVDAWSKAPSCHDDDDNEEAGEAWTPDRFASGMAVANVEGDTPLHLACWLNAPVDVLTYLLSLWPRAICIKNRSGQTPLQRASKPCRGVPAHETLQFLRQQLTDRFFNVCQKAYPSLDHLKEVLQAYPQVVQETKNGAWPIHSLLQAEHLSLEAVVLLVTAWPASLLCSDQYGANPLHLTCQRLPPVTHENHGVTAATVDYLIRPETVRGSDRQGNLPLHTACGNPYTTQALLDRLLYAWPESVVEVNQAGELPWQVASRADLPSSMTIRLADLAEAAEDTQSLCSLA